MPKANLFNMAGKQIGEVELSEAVFGIEPNQYVVHDVVKNHLANCRQGTQSSLTTPARAPPGPPSGPTAASCSPPSPAATAPA